MTSYGYPSVTNAKALKGLCLLLTFEDGNNRIFDAKPMLKGMEGKWLGELLNEEYFKQVFVDDGVVQWPNEQDICPDCIYEDSVPVFQYVSKDGIAYIPA